MESMVTDIKKIHNKTQGFLNYLTTYGNECAYTDRMVEQIIDFAHELEEKYNRNFNQKYDETEVLDSFAQSENNALDLTESKNKHL